MSCDIREMREPEAEQVVDMVHGLARDTAPGVVPKLTVGRLLAARDLIDVVVAVESGRLLGACLGLMTYSTWRGTRGLYVVDLFVAPEARGRSLGLAVLRETARRAVAKGAGFIKLEVDLANDGAARFYTRIGFAKNDADRLFVLEQDRLKDFIAKGDAA